MKKESIKLLKKKLSIIKQVHCHRWDNVRDIVAIFPSIIVKEKECVDWMYEHKFDLSNIKTWSTYDNYSCISLTFYLESNKLHCDAIIWNGDSLYGNRKSRRFTATLVLPMNFIKNISGDIDWKFNEHLSSLYEIHLENVREKWIEEAGKTLLV